MTPIELKGYLLDILKDELGTYTTSTKRSFPSIWISPPLVPTDWKVNGLECTIYLWGEDLGNQSVSGNERLERSNLIVDLVQFDNSKSVVPSLNLIKRYFPRVQSKVNEQTRDSYESCRLSIFNPVFYKNLNNERPEV